MKRKQPTLPQLDVIHAYANKHGRNWKSRLRDSWENGIYFDEGNSNVLQTIRNEFGPSWLNSFRIPKKIGV